VKAVIGEARRSPTSAVLRAVVHVYRAAISPLMGPRCRFLPTCSDYALAALAQHRPGHALALIGRRLGRCHPFGASGIDEVPPADSCRCARHSKISLLFPKDSTGS
jgi:putative membrane protein insertion efficiency factor